MAIPDLLARLRDDNTIGCNDDGTIRNIQLCDEAADRIEALETGLRDLVSLLADTGFHNAIEMAAARKLIRHPGWTKAGHAWLDEGALLARPGKIDQCEYCHGVTRHDRTCREVKLG